MKISKSAEIKVSNAKVSFGALAAFLRVIQEVFLSVLPQDEKGDIKWDITLRTAQGEVNSLSSSLLEGEVKKWIEERVILTIWTEITSFAEGFRREVSCRFTIGGIPTIIIRGNSDFVDLMHLRLTEWNNDLPCARFSFFRLFVFIFSSCVAICSFFAFAYVFLSILEQWELTMTDMWGIIADIIRVSLLGGGMMAGVFVGTSIAKMWPCVDLNIGLPTKEQIRRGKIIKGVKWIAGGIAVLGGLIGIYSFFLH